MFMALYSFDHVAIDHFRGLRKLQLEGLGRFNILVGGNNSGKTSVLEAMSLLCNPFEPSEWLAMVRRRDFGRLDETKIQSLRWCFPQSGALVNADVMFESECVLSCRGSFPLRRLRATYRDIIGEPDSRQIEHNGRHQRNAEDVDSLEPRRGAELVHFIEMDTNPFQPDRFGSPETATIEPIAVQVWEDDVMFHRPLQEKPSVRAETLTPYSYQINQVQVRYHSKRLFDKSRDMVLSLVQEFDGDIQGIEVASLRGERPALYLNHRRLGPAPFRCLAMRCRRAVLLASTLSSLQDGGVLFIDEIETGIHFSLLPRIFHWLIQAARTLRVQIFSTTHSLEAVDAFLAGSGANTDDIVTYHLEQTKEQTIIKRFGDDLLARLRIERGLDVR